MSPATIQIVRESLWERGVEFGRGAYPIACSFTEYFADRQDLSSSFQHRY